MSPFVNLSENPTVVFGPCHPTGDGEIRPLQGSGGDRHRLRGTGDGVDRHEDDMTRKIGSGLEVVRVTEAAVRALSLAEEMMKTNEVQERR